MRDPSEPLPQMIESDGAMSARNTEGKTDHGLAALSVLVEISQGKSADPMARVEAANSILAIALSDAPDDEVKANDE